jgi:serine/threonine protein kinase
MKSFFNKMLRSKHEHLADYAKKAADFNLDPNKIFQKIENVKTSTKCPNDIYAKCQSILDELHLNYYIFDNIAEINGKRTNHQELLYCENSILTTVSVNKIYCGKLKIWHHVSVRDHICPSETTPYSIIDVAVKIIEHSDAADNENNEPEMLHMLHGQPEIIELLGYHIDPSHKQCMLVMEWCGGGDLFSYIEQNYHRADAAAIRNLICKVNIPVDHGAKIIRISLLQIKQIVMWLINAVIKCHKHNICYSDLKLDNIMFGSTNDVTSLKLIDFGAAVFTHDNGSEIIYKFISTSIHYTPPEIINAYYIQLNCDFLTNYHLAGENLFRIDIWQIGVIVYTLLNGHFPYDSKLSNKKNKYADIFSQISACHPPKYTKNIDIEGYPLCDNLAIDFISKLMEFDPAKRIPLEIALEHPWLRSF